MINLVTTIVFLLPFAIYFDGDNSMKYCSAALGTLVLTILTPPIGFYRPHPYSDWGEKNHPVRFKKV